MKNLILVLFVTTLFVQCGSKESVVQKNLPFNISSKTYQDWTGGKEGSSGTNLVIKGSILTGTVQFVSVFFHNREIPANVEFSNEQYTIFAPIVNKKKDMKMSNAPQGEYGNQAPTTGKKIPFDLKDNEAVLYYHVKGKEYYYKVSDIKKLDLLIMP